MFLFLASLFWKIGKTLERGLRNIIRTKKVQNGVEFINTVTSDSRLFSEGDVVLKDRWSET